MSRNYYGCVPLCFFLLLIAISNFLSIKESHAGWRDVLEQLKNKYEQRNAGTLSEKDIVEGLKEALRVGATKSINILGKKDGFYKDMSVKIPMPDNLIKVDRLLRRFGGGDIADKFIKTMNRAAEQAVQSTLKIFVKSIKEMTLSDAVNIYKGRKDEATRYFKRKEGRNLEKTILPIVKNATENTGVTLSYKRMVNKLQSLHLPIETHFEDLDNYITKKTVDGIFYKVAQEEAQIRTNPKARTTDILKKVFAN